MQISELMNHRDGSLPHRDNRAGEVTLSSLCEGVCLCATHISFHDNDDDDVDRVAKMFAHRAISRGPFVKSGRTSCCRVHTSASLPPLVSSLRRDTIKAPRSRAHSGHPRERTPS